MVLLVGPSYVTPPESAPSLWTPLQHTWTDYRGTDWDLSQGLSGLALAPGVRGMEMPTPTHYKITAPAVDGSFWRGTITPEREATWFLRVFSDAGSQAWIDHRSRFWKGLNPSRTGLWTVTQPNGVKRSLRVRFAGLSDDSDDGSELFGWKLYQISLAAEDPFWLGEADRRTFVAPSAGENYYGGAAGGGFGPPFYISAGSTTDSAAISNPGDVDAWPVWTVYGPTTSVSVGLNGRAIEFPMTLTAGQWVRIDTRPTDQQAIDHSGSDRTPQLGLVEFAEIPPGTNVPLTISMTGTGSVTVEVTPRYFLAT